MCHLRKCPRVRSEPPNSPYTNFSSNKPMNDFFEIADAPGEIFDIPEMQDLDEENKFDYNEYILSNIDY